MLILHIAQCIPVLKRDDRNQFSYRPLKRTPRGEYARPQHLRAGLVMFRPFGLRNRFNLARITLLANATEAKSQR